MNGKKVLLAGMVLVLTGACVWGATEASGFTAVPESEAAQIVGGDGYGYYCDLAHPLYPEVWIPCSANGYNNGCAYSNWYFLEIRYGCAEGGSGECYNYEMEGGLYGECEWNPEAGESGECWYISEYVIPVLACG